jgi:ribonuclease R
MAREAQLMQNRRGDWLIPDKADLVRGRVTGHPDGYGFLTPEGGGSDLFLAAKEMDKVLHGDKVIARVIGVDRKGRPEGKIVEVTERANRFVVGRVIEEHGVRFVAAENKRISQDILLAPPEKGREEGAQGASRPGGDDRIDRAAEQARTADRAPGRSARQLCRPRHGNRDRAAQA